MVKLVIHNNKLNHPNLVKMVAESESKVELHHDLSGHLIILVGIALFINDIQ